MKLSSDSKAAPGNRGKIRVEWHEREGVVELLHENVVLDDKSVIPWWRDQWVPQLDALVQKLGRKFPLLVCIDGLTIRPVVADEYGATAKMVTGRCCTKVARYGAPSTVRPLIATEALKMDYKANLFDNRADAIKFLKG